MKAGNYKDYQDFCRKTDWMEPEFKDSSDYFDDFIADWMKGKGVKDVSDEDYDVIKKYWYKFCDGNSDHEEFAVNYSIEQMKEELEECA